MRSNSMQMMRLHSLLAVFLMIVQGAHAQQIQITRAEVKGEAIQLEYELLNVPVYLEAELQFSVRASNGSTDVVVSPEDRTQSWVRANQIHAVRLNLPQAVVQRSAPNLHVTVTPKAYRVMPALLGSGIAGSALGLTGWGIAASKAAQLNGNESNGLRTQALTALTVGSAMGVLGAATLLTWKKWNDKLQARRWSIQPITISLNLATSRSVQVDRSVNLEGQPCVFEVAGELPQPTSTLQVILDRSCSTCKSLALSESKWTSLFSRSYSITSRSEELERTVMREQQFWLSNIVPEDWSLEVGAISGADFTAWLSCECKSGAAVQLKFIDNRTGETAWMASGDACLADQFFQEVQLVFHH